MSWASYWSILRRRWVIVLVIIVLDVAASGYLYRKAHVSAGYQSCLTLYVGDLGAPSTIIAPGSNALDTQSQALAGETAANFFGDDIVDVAQTRSVAAFVARHAGPKLSPSTFDGAISGSRLDRTVNLCVTNASASLAQKAGQALATALTTDRKLFFGPMATRIYAGVVSSPQTSPAPTSHAVLSLLLRVFLGVLVALGVAFLWDALDPAVRDRTDLERALGAPVLA